MRKPSASRFLLPIMLFRLLVTSVFAEVLPSILWNPENPIFSYLGSSARKVMPFDKLSLICPNTVEYPIKRRDSYSRDELYENIFMVDKRGYDNCNATGGFKILLCDNPMACRHTTLVFKQVSASAEDPEFHPGREYYFINTASGSLNSLKNMEGGRCNQGMKMKIYVCNASSDPRCPSGNAVIHGGWSAWSNCEGGFQTRLCNNLSPENGGVVCIGESKRPCSTKSTQASPTAGTTSIQDPTTVRPGSPSKENRTGDVSPPYNGFRISKGLFYGICGLMLLCGIVPGVALSMVLHRRRTLRRPNIPVEPTIPSSRPVSLFSTASESAKMVST